MSEEQVINFNSQGQVGQKRLIPINSVELLHETTEPSWGKPADIPLELKEKISHTKLYRNEDTGEIQFDRVEYWDLLAYYTRDMRLANLNNVELDYCAYWLDLSGDLLREGYIQSFVAALARVITVLELSQSKKGFFRKRMGTITTENKQTLDEKKQKNLFSMRGRQ